MGRIDVSELFSDPDFVDPITIIHCYACVDNFGVNQITEKAEYTIGCIQPASGKTLQRLPDSLRVAGIMSFWVNGRIITDGNGKNPDIIVLRGERYRVTNIFDWTNWGDGWTEGTCVRERIA